MSLGSLTKEIAFRSSLTVKESKKAVEKTAKQKQIDVKEVVQVLSDVYEEKNYFCVYPSAWILDRKASRLNGNELIKLFVKDVDRLKKLNHIKTHKGLRVASYNIHYWFSPGGDLNFDSIMGVIDRVDADVICLQEVVMPESGRAVESSDGWSDPDFFSIFEALGYKYWSKCKADIVHAKKGSMFGNAIVSKKPLEEISSISLPVNVQGRCLALAKVDGIIIASVHLDVFDGTGTVRKKQIQEVLDHLDRGEPTILCGDFNALQESDYTDIEINWLKRNTPRKEKLDFETIEIVKARGYEDAFDGIKFSVWSARRVDYIFTKNLKVEHSSVYYSSASDHIPLSIDVKPSLDLRETARGSAKAEPSSRLEEFIRIVRDKGDTRGIFNQLLFTHNTNLNVAFSMFAGEFTGIRCCTPDGKVISRGAQFRWGLDSQYGDAKLIMKPGFWQKYTEGAYETGRGIKKVDYVVFNDLWKEIQGKYEEVKDTLELEAREYTFRERKRSPEIPCQNRDFTWCNYQIHIAQNVSLDDIEKVILPKYLLSSKAYASSSFGAMSIPKFIDMIQTQAKVFGKDNPFKGKLMFSGGDTPSSYYAWVSENLADYDKYLGDSEIPRSRKEEEIAVEQGTQRPRELFGNSSLIANKIEVFREEQEKYMLLLLEHGFYD